MKGKVNHDKSVELLKAIERFIFIEFRLQMTRSHYGSSEFNKAAVNFIKVSRLWITLLI